MQEIDLEVLGIRFEQLLNRVEQLKAQNRLLLSRYQTLQQEREQLLEKNEQARAMVESMIVRLKALEHPQ